MASMNPLILKELLQAAHRRRTYALRAGVTLLAAVIIGFRLYAYLSVLECIGYDWRQMADIARPVFEVTVWIQLFVFAFMALAYGAEALQLEWTRRTMEVLCATPISKRAIVFGKFTSVLCRILLVAVALLPILVIAFSLGHIPAGLALGSLAVIAAGTTMCAAVALLFSSLYRPGNRGWDIQTLLYIAAPLTAFIAAVIHWQDSPFIVAALPPWAFYFVMSDSAPQQMGATLFKILAVVEPFLIAGLALWLAPLAFDRSFSQFEGGGPVAGWRKATSAWARRIFGRRPTLGDEENPFEWQEKGIGTVALRWSVWSVYLVILLITLAFRQEMRQERFFVDPGFFLVLASVAAAVLTLVGGMYGVDVFVREKERRTVEALLLTGNAPSKLYFAKLKAAYVALRWPLASVAGVLLLALLLAHFSGREADSVAGPVTIIAVCCLLGPALAAIIGMVFGAAARTRGQAISAIICSPFLAWLLFMPVQVIATIDRYGTDVATLSLWIAAGSIAVIFAVRWFTRNWTAWHLSLMLAATELLIGAVISESGQMGIAGESADLLFLVAVIAVVAAGLFWYRLGVTLFDRCMLNLVGRPGKK